MLFQGANCVLGVLLLVFIVEATSQKYVKTVYRRPLPPPSPPKIQRARRDVGDDPLWLYQGDDIRRAPATGDHPYLPPYVDDIKIDPHTRYARSVDSPSAKRGGGSHSTSSSSRNTGATHPGYNRRNARSLSIPARSPFNPFPEQEFPEPSDFPYPIYRVPGPVRPRIPRAADNPSFQKPTHYEVVIPGWNPNARIEPWQKIKVRKF